MKVIFIFDFIIIRIFFKDDATSNLSLPPYKLKKTSLAKTASSVSSNRSSQQQQVSSAISSFDSPYVDGNID
jgi:hypothetical protein